MRPARESCSRATLFSVQNKKLEWYSIGSCEFQDLDEIPPNVRSAPPDA